MLMSQGCLNDSLGEKCKAGIYRILICLGSKAPTPIDVFFELRPRCSVYSVVFTPHYRRLLIRRLNTKFCAYLIRDKLNPRIMFHP
jgi:hypothetical protein